MLRRRVPGSDVSSRVAQTHSVLHDELHIALRVDCSPNLTRLLTTARVWRENVVWSHSVVVIYYSLVNVDGGYVTPMFLP